MSKIEQNSQNPKLNLEKLRKLVDGITKFALQAIKTISRRTYLKSSLLLLNRQQKRKNFKRVIEGIITRTEIRLNNFLISSQCVLITVSENIALKRRVII